MSVYQNSVKALIKVIESHSNLISDQDWEDLATFNSNISDDKDEEDVVGALDEWLSSRSQILNAYQNELDFITANSDLNLGGYLGPGGSKSPTSPNQPSQPAKELIDNAIKRNYPLSDNKKSH